MRLAAHLRRLGAASGDWWGGAPLQRKRRAPNAFVSASRAPMIRAYTAVSMAPCRATGIARHGRGMAGAAVPPMQTPPESKGKLTVKFGFPVAKENEAKEVPKHKAMQLYMLQDFDFLGLTSVQGSSPGSVYYRMEDLERAAVQRWGSEKEFKREQLRREIKRRRSDLRSRSSNEIADDLSHTLTRAAPIFGGIKSLRTTIARYIPMPLARINRNELYGGLPWDPALGAPPSDTTIVGTRAVYTAIGTNSIMVVSKLAAFGVTGSASILSEAVHSIADLGNQCLLIVGINQSLKEADAAHPYGYATERYVWSLISGVGIFFIGAGVSVYHGLAGLLHPHEIEHYLVGMSVLGSAFAIEGYSLYIALGECRYEAKKQSVSLYDYVVHGSDTMNVAVLTEDAVAVLGCGIAGVCLTLAHVTGNSMWDSLGSVLVGGLLGLAAMTLVNKNRELLVGTSVPPKRLEHVLSILESDPVVHSVHDVKAIMIGSDRGRFKAEIKFDSSEIAVRCMKKMELTGQLSRFERPMLRDEVSAALQVYSHELLWNLGDEVDRLEGIIRRELPEIRHVDLEIL